MLCMSFNTLPFRKCFKTQFPVITCNAISFSCCLSTGHQNHCLTWLVSSVSIDPLSFCFICFPLILDIVLSPPGVICSFCLTLFAFSKSLCFVPLFSFTFQCIPSIFFSFFLLCLCPHATPIGPQVFKALVFNPTVLAVQWQFIPCWEIYLHFPNHPRQIFSQQPH